MPASIGLLQDPMTFIATLPKNVDLDSSPELKYFGWTLSVLSSWTTT